MAEIDAKAMRELGPQGAWMYREDHLLAQARTDVRSLFFSSRIRVEGF